MGEDTERVRPWLGKYTNQYHSVVTSLGQEQNGCLPKSEHERYPHDRREGVLLFVRSTFGTTTLNSCRFEIVFTHGPSLV